jgi:uncharacterized membrane protein YfcA
VIAVAVAAGGQAVTAIGFSLIAVPFVTVAIGAAAAVPTVNLLAGGLNIVMLNHERRDVRWRDALNLFIPAAIVIPFVAIAIRHLSGDALSIIAGVMIVASCAILASGLRAPSLAGRRGAVVAGALSGAGNVATGVGGPFAAMYAINADWPAKAYRPTMQAYFLGINIVSVTSRGLPSADRPGLLTAMVVSGGVGWAIGRRVAASVDHELVRNLTLVVATAGGIVAIVRGIV